MGDILTTSYSLSQYIVTFGDKLLSSKPLSQINFDLDFTGHLCNLLLITTHKIIVIIIIHGEHQSNHQKRKNLRNGQSCGSKKKTWHPSMILLSTTIKSICNLYLYLSQPSHRIPHIYWDKYSRFDNGLIVHCEASTHFFTFHNMFHGHTIPCCSFPPILIFQFGTLVSLNRVVGICCSFSVHETYSDALTIAKRYKKRKIFYSIFYEKKDEK